MRNVKRALIVVDVQNEYFTGALKIEYPDVKVSMPNICAAMDFAHDQGIPVVVIRHESAEGAPAFAPGTDGAALHPEISRRPSDLQVLKHRPSALDGTELATWLHKRGIETLSIIGYMTHNCDHATTLQAGFEGFKVELLHDATGALPYENAVGRVSAEEIHRVFTVVQHTGFAAVASTAQWMEAVRADTALASDSVVASNQRALAG